ncbi:hypothetical protein AVEN_122980-1, partial [Araneus ventricosus]
MIGRIPTSSHGVRLKVSSSSGSHHLSVCNTVDIQAFTDISQHSRCRATSSNCGRESIERIPFVYRIVSTDFVHPLHRYPWI